MPLSSVWTVWAFWPSDHCCGSSQLSRTHVKTFKSLKIEFEIQHTAHTMASDDPDLQAFESNLR